MNWLNKVKHDCFGRFWDIVPLQKRCHECGQPDSLGKCSHKKLPISEVLKLGGSPNDEEFTILTEVAEEEGKCGICPKCKAGKTDDDCIFVE